MAPTRLPGFDDMVRAQRTGWLAAAAVITGDRSRAEEVVQEVLGRAASRWNEVGELDRPGAWVRRAVVNEAISGWRKQRSERRAVELLSARPAPPTSMHEPDPELWAVVRELPAQQCRAVALHYGADLSLADVAADLGLTVPATKTLLYRARGELRDRLAASHSMTSNLDDLDEGGSR